MCRFVVYKEKTTVSHKRLNYIAQIYTLFPTVTTVHSHTRSNMIKINLHQKYANCNRQSDRQPNDIHLCYRETHIPQITYIITVMTTGDRINYLPRSSISILTRDAESCCQPPSIVPSFPTEPLSTQTQTQKERALTFCLVLNLIQFDLCRVRNRLEIVNTKTDDACPVAVCYSLLFAASHLTIYFFTVRNCHRGRKMTVQEHNFVFFIYYPL